MSSRKDGGTVIEYSYVGLNLYVRCVRDVEP